MLIKSVRGKSPQIPDSCFIAENATIVGDVEMGEECSVWFNAVVRGDVNSIRMGNRVNVQDGVVIHATYQESKTQIGNNVSIGHNAVVHGCTLKDNVLVGMGGIIMDHAVVESNSIIAAGAVVPKNMKIESNSVYGGIPARKIMDIREDLSKGEIERIAQNYVLYASWFQSDQ